MTDKIKSSRRPWSSTRRRKAGKPTVRAGRGALAVAAMLAVGSSAIGASAHAAPAQRSTTRPSLSPTQFTRYTFNASGEWHLTSHYTTEAGVPTPANPPADNFYVNLQLMPDTVSPMANDPVYESDRWSGAGGAHHLIAGEVLISPFVAQGGIELTVWLGGNTELQPGGSEAVYTLRSVNTTQAPLTFTGTWTDTAGDTGTSVLTPAPGTILLPPGT